LKEKDPSLKPENVVFIDDKAKNVEAAKGNAYLFRTDLLNFKQNLDSKEFNFAVLKVISVS
jgi:hypothetical protein